MGREPGHGLCRDLYQDHGQDLHLYQDHYHYHNLYLNLYLNRRILLCGQNPQKSKTGAHQRATFRGWGAVSERRDDLSKIERAVLWSTWMPIPTS